MSIYLFSVLLKRSSLGFDMNALTPKEALCLPLMLAPGLTAGGPTNDQRLTECKITSSHLRIVVNNFEGDNLLFYVETVLKATCATTQTKMPKI